MQKHAERTDKRPPITALGIRTTGVNNNTTGGSGNTGSGGSSGAASGGGGNTGSGGGGGGGSTNDHPYWPKVSDANMDGMTHERMAEACLQTTLGDTHGRLLGRDHIDHRQLGGEDLRHSAHLPPPPQVSYESAIVTSKTTSAFTPIQSATMLPITTGAQLSMPSSSRPYIPYDPISFPKTPGQVTGMDMKTSSNTFPNQLISLHQIRNYAHQPSMASEHLLGLKEKSQ